MAKHHILISSGGRRIGLANCFRESLIKRAEAGWVGTIDSGLSAPLSFLADKWWRVPKCTEPHFVETVLAICQQHEVELIIPTTDRELEVWVQHRSRFAGLGISVALSAPETIAIAWDKAKTHSWLVANGFPTVRQACVCEVLRSPDDWRFPLIAKPRNGSASEGLRTIATPEDLTALSRVQIPYLVQEIARGREFTINVFVDKAGACIAAVPHWRMEVRGGEVSKGLTVKDPELMSIGRRIAEALPGARGPLNIQCFAHELDGIKVIEINARFGGGYPLAHQAGAKFTEWLLDELEGRSLSPCDDWLDDLAMLRYDSAIFVAGSRIRA
jgi:carbamoyl-phosphate synthase large subunit